MARAKSSKAIVQKQNAKTRATLKKLKAAEAKAAKAKGRRGVKSLGGSRIDTTTDHYGPTYSWENE